jgi:hypothetical protein
MSTLFPEIRAGVIISHDDRFDTPIYGDTFFERGIIRAGVIIPHDDRFDTPIYGDTFSERGIIRAGVIISHDDRFDTPIYGDTFFERGTIMAEAIISHDDRFDGVPCLVGREGSRVEVLRAIRRNLNFMWESCHGRLTVCHFTVHLTGFRTEEANKTLCGALQSLRKGMLFDSVRFEDIDIIHPRAMIFFDYRTTDGDADHRDSVGKVDNFHSDHVLHFFQSPVFPMLSVCTVVERPFPSNYAQKSRGFTS